MRIQSISIKNFRSLKDVSIDLRDYSVLAGPNGAGKSSVLYAIDWFFSGALLDDSDVSFWAQPSAASEPPHLSDAQNELNPDNEVSVSVTFDLLSAADRSRLAEYGRGDTATFKRVWKPGDAKSKTFGSALAGPGFAAIRGMSRVGDFRPAYAAARAVHNGLADLGPSPQKSAVLQALADWESDPTNHSSLELVANSDAAHIFGFNGTSVIQQCVRFILIPAAIDIADDVGRSAKGSTLNELIGGLMSDAGSAARAEWFAKNKAELEALSISVTSSVVDATRVQEERINERLAALVPNTRIVLNAKVPDWTPKGEAVVSTSVAVNGNVNDITRQGHGLQRAVMIAMFEALAPDEDLVRGTQTPVDGESEEQAEERIRRSLAQLPHLIVAIEEPEIYQHPVRARAFARVLTELAENKKSQVIVATHSPYFLRPQKFESLRRFWLVDDKTQVTSTDAPAVAAAAGCDPQHVEKIVAKRLPNTFAEGFFSDAVVLVEGDTDKIVLETLGEVLNTPLDALGVSVLDMSGKDGIVIPSRILGELGTPTYIIADGDALGHTRSKNPIEAQKSHRSSTEAICAQIPMADATAREGTLPYSYGDPTVVSDLFSIWHDDVESELSAWPSFLAALDANGSKLRSKDLLAYRTAVLDADVADMPSALRRCVESVAAFASRSTSRASGSVSVGDADCPS